MSLEKYQKKVKNFFENIQKQKTAVLHHRDPDGLGSGIITFKALEKITGKKPDFMQAVEYDEILSLIPELEKKNFKKIIMVDLSVDSMGEKIKQFEKFADVLIIDHHKVYQNLESDKTLFIKASFISDIDPSKYPASKLCFDLFSAQTSLEEFQWIVCCGILGDMGFEQWKDFFEQTYEKNSTNLKELEQLTELINAVETVEPEKFDELVIEFVNAKNSDEMKQSVFQKDVKKLKEEADKWLKDFENAEFYEKIGLYFFIIKPKYDIKSFVSNTLSQKYYDKTLVVVQDLGKTHLTLSARRQDFKIKMNELLEKATDGIGSGGGHVPAAGGRIPREKLKPFKENVLTILGEK